MSVSNLGDLVATAQLDISPFMNNTRQLQIYMRGLDSSLRTVEKSFKGQKDKLSGLKATHTQVSHNLKGYQELLKKQTNIYNNLKTEIGDVNSATSKQKEYLVGAQSAMAATASKVAELQSKYNALTREIAIQSSSWTTVGDNLRKSGGELKTFGDNLSGVGKSLSIGVTAPILAGAGYAVKAAVQYESAFAGVRKTVDETATTSYETLSKSIRQLSKELPASAVEIANVAEIAGQLGINADNIIGFTKVMIDLGESTNMSATNAATALAKFANITKLAPEDYEKLGSSIVDLGNNFATTEENITDMALRLAGAGSQIGLSQADIVGLSAALSSVGIEAEMGGTAFSKLMVKMQLAVTSGADGMANLTEQTGLSRREFELLLANSPKDFKDLADSIGMTSTEMANIVKASANLEDFSRIAGMTADEFKQKFETDAVGAIGAFINGLGTAEEKGESAIEMLNEMGFTEVRLRDALLRSGNAQELFTKAIDTSNGAWKENKALTEEANKRYETAESKLEMLRNEVTDVAIEVGGPLVDALRDGLEAVKPWIQKAADLAKAFSKLDKQQQQQIIKWGFIAAAAGPALSIMGNGIGVIGSVFKGLGTMSTAIGKLSGVLKAAKEGVPIVEAFAGATSTATTATSGWSSALGLLASPTTWSVLLGGAAIATIGYFSAQAIDAKARTEEWGTEVDRVQAGELSRYKEKVDEMTQSMELFGTNGKNDIEEVESAVKSLVDEITKLTDEQLAKDIELAKKLGLSDEVVNTLKKNAEESKVYTQRVSDEILSIYQRHSNDRTKLSAAEKETVKGYQTELINKQLELMNYSKSERVAIQKALNGELYELNKTQLDSSWMQTYNWMKDEKKAYKEHKAELKNLLEKTGEEDVAARQEINKQLEQLESDHVAVMDTYKDKFIAIMREKWEREKEIYRDRPEELAVIQESYKDILKEYGMTWEEFSAITSENTESVASDFKYLGKIIEGMSEQAVEANKSWKNLIWDEKNATLKSNALEEIKNASLSEEGWNNLNFILKNATIDSNARQMIVDAVSSTDRWNKLSINEKQMIVDGNQAMIEIATSQDLINQWNALTPQQKQLLATDLTANPTQSAQTAIDNVKQLTPAQIQAKNNTANPVREATSTLDKVKDKHVSITADATNANIAVDNLLGSLNSLVGRTWTTVVRTVTEKVAKNATGTNFHPGGLAMVNDQKGSTYRELITLPTGHSFIPEGRDVILPLPRGSKVLKASDTKKLFPHYAEGIGFENTGIARLAQRIGRISTTQSISVVGNDNSNLQQLLSVLVDLTRDGNVITSKMIDAIAKLSIVIDGEPIAKFVTERQSKREAILNAVYGKGWD